MQFTKLKPRMKVAIGGGAVLLLVMVILLAIHLHDKSAAKNAVLERLKDPESAVFGEYTKVGDGACLGVNAKNAMGGYVGQQQAILERSEEGWSVSGFEETSHIQCVSELQERNASSPSMSEICKRHEALIKRLRKENKATADLEAAGKQLGCR